MAGMHTVKTVFYFLYHRWIMILASMTALAVMLLVYLDWSRVKLGSSTSPDDAVIQRLFQHQQEVRTMYKKIARRINLHSKTKPMVTVPRRTFIIYDWSHYNKFIGHHNKLIVDNCVIKRTSGYIADADAVAITLAYDKTRVPPTRGRNRNQRWIFLFDDTFANFEPMRCMRASDYNGVFNWTMTYRSNSDVHIPYGATVPLTTPLPISNVNYAANKSSLAFALISNCVAYFNNRLVYIRDLQQHMNVDFYGGCGTLHCDGNLHTSALCNEVRRYKFFLAFENTNCKDYITEKFWRILQYDVVPVVMGAPKSDYLKMAPPGSFIHVDDFESPKKLASYLQFLSDNDKYYNTYFKWKRFYQVESRIQYVGNVIWKTLCDKLNRDDGKIKSYGNFEKWVNIDLTCPNLVDRYHCGD